MTINVASAQTKACCLYSRQASLMTPKRMSGQVTCSAFIADLVDRTSRRLAQTHTDATRSSRTEALYRVRDLAVNIDSFDGARQRSTAANSPPIGPMAWSRDWRARVPRYILAVVQIAGFLAIKPANSNLLSAARKNEVARARQSPHDELRGGTDDILRSTVE